MNHKNKFRIDAFTGAISTKAGIIINDEENAVYDLSVVASDRGRPALRYLFAFGLIIRQFPCYYLLLSVLKLLFKFTI